MYLIQTHSKCLNYPFNEHKLTEIYALFFAQVSDAIFERISLSATGFCRYDRNQAGLIGCLYLSCDSKFPLGRQGWGHIHGLGQDGRRGIPLLYIWSVLQ